MTGGGTGVLRSLGGGRKCFFWGVSYGWSLVREEGLA